MPSSLLSPFLLRLRLQERRKWRGGRKEEEGRGPKRKGGMTRKRTLETSPKFDQTFLPFGTIYLEGIYIYIKQNCLFVMSVIFNSIPKRLCSLKMGWALGRVWWLGGRGHGGITWREGPMTRNFA